MNPVQAVVFDFDGTIANSEPAHHQAFQMILAPHGAGFDMNYYNTELLGFQDYAVFKVMFAKRYPDFKPEKLDYLCTQSVKAKSEAFKTLFSVIEFNPGFEELLEYLHGKVRLAICSGALKQDILGIFAAKAGAKLLEKFETVIGADNVLVAKPDPAGYKLACKNLGIEPKFAVAIEDTPVGLTAAIAAGLQTIGFTHSLPRAQLSIANHVIGHLLETKALLKL